MSFLFNTKGWFYFRNRKRKYKIMFQDRFPSEETSDNSSHFNTCFQRTV